MALEVGMEISTTKADEQKQSRNMQCNDGAVAPRHRMIMGVTAGKRNANSMECTIVHLRLNMSRSH